MVTTLLSIFQTTPHEPPLDSSKKELFQPVQERYEVSHCWLAMEHILRGRRIQHGIPDIRQRHLRDSHDRRHRRQRLQRRLRGRSIPRESFLVSRGQRPATPLSGLDVEPVVRDIESLRRAHFLTERAPAAQQPPCEVADVGVVAAPRLLGEVVRFSHSDPPEASVA